MARAVFGICGGIPLPSPMWRSSTSPMPPPPGSQAPSRTDRAAGRSLLLGGLFAIPVPHMPIWARDRSWVIAANVLWGINRGPAWSTTAVMKIDLDGPARHALATGLNEAVGYGAMAAASMLAGSPRACWCEEPAAPHSWMPDHWPLPRARPHEPADHGPGQPAGIGLPFAAGGGGRCRPARLAGPCRCRPSPLAGPRLHGQGRARGLVADALGMRTALWVAAVLNVATALAASWCLRETHPTLSRRFPPTAGTGHVGVPRYCRRR